MFRHNAVLTLLFMCGKKKSMPYKKEHPHHREEEVTLAAKQITNAPVFDAESCMTQLAILTANSDYPLQKFHAEINILLVFVLTP